MGGSFVIEPFRGQCGLLGHAFKPLDNERVEGAGDEEHVGDRLPIADGDQRAVQAGRSETDGEQDQKRLKLICRLPIARVRDSLVVNEVIAAASAVIE
ncbi:hypothetical protein [Nitrobacter vulgaris]|uniref:Uncharacterized protein n=1 Tax=Nitrobacter vulgaris TaxID=29421 RepID=A0A1V4I0T4_NITVU|nr:hypothetical protein [Nitrobacter vulgaris]OPH83851.1 hypothetical protein B2M20_04910 [Nitrobacter vulgaris]